MQVDPLKQSFKYVHHRSDRQDRHHGQGKTHLLLVKMLDGQSGKASMHAVAVVFSSTLFQSKCRRKPTLLIAFVEAKGSATKGEDIWVLSFLGLVFWGRTYSTWE